ncbi:hypothetical protein BUALT_Bualt17G0058100 [Buddleja alternifolia]|uniref:Glutathione S-transferase n=1 Tax=Buddleja alternifolia TaxID=168488 RepID=A0AAV6WCR6_9LAMI|nr:hypothetical protein BUALT_Bualt17G0058100 [Buddleja alternifolia]
MACVDELLDECPRAADECVPVPPTVMQNVAICLNVPLDDKWYRRLTAIILSQGEEAKKAALEDTIQGLNLLEETFAKCSKGKKFFGGGKIGYLDIALGSFVVWMRATQKLANVSLIDESKTPNLFKWAQDFSAHVAVKDVLPETDKLLEFLKFYVVKPKSRL